MSRLRRSSVLVHRVSGVLLCTLGSIFFLADYCPADEAKNRFPGPTYAALGTHDATSKQESLAQRIDHQLKSSLGDVVAPPIDDAHFLRRVYLDFAGRIPSLDESRAFLAESDAHKRAKLVDRLLADLSIRGE